MDEFLAPDGVADYLGVPVSVVCRLLESGELPGEIVENEWWIQLSDVQAYCWIEPEDQGFHTASADDTYSDDWLCLQELDDLTVDGYGQRADLSEGNSPYLDSLRLSAPKPDVTSVVIPTAHKHSLLSVAGWVFGGLSAIGYAGNALLYFALETVAILDDPIQFFNPFLHLKVLATLLVTPLFWLLVVISLVGLGGSSFVEKRIEASRAS